MSEIKQPAVPRKKIEQLTEQVAHCRRRYERCKAESASEREPTEERLRELKSEFEIAKMRLVSAKRA